MTFTINNDNMEVVAVRTVAVAEVVVRTGSKRRPGVAVAVVALVGQGSVGLLEEGVELVLGQEEGVELVLAQEGQPLRRAPFLFWFSSPF